MAKNNSTIKTLTATSYIGEIERTIDNLKFLGSCAVNGDKTLQNANGRVEVQEATVAIFDIMPVVNNQHRFAVSQCDDVALLAQISTALGTVYAGILEDLAPETPAAE